MSNSTNTTQFESEIENRQQINPTTSPSEQSDRDCRLGGTLPLRKGTEVTVWACDDKFVVKIEFFNQGGSFELTEENSEVSVKYPVPGYVSGGVFGLVTIEIKADFDEYTVEAVAERCTYKTPLFGGYQCNTVRETLDLSHLKDEL